MLPQITFSIRTNNEELLKKLDEDALKQERSRNFIVNKILLTYYGLTTQREVS